MSHVTMLFSLSPAIALVIGGWLLAHLAGTPILFSWR